MLSFASKFPGHGWFDLLSEKFKERLRFRLWDGFSWSSYSQEGEDVVLNRLLCCQKTGFYVDVGAHHPLRFSNTHLFHRRGWRGINIDATPGSMESFRKIRPEDINLECGVGLEAGVLPLYVFHEGALNTFDLRVAELWRSQGAGDFHRAEVKVLPLKQIFEQFIPKGLTIDFLNVDVEGLDLPVLQSNDWSRYRPRYVLAEIGEHALSSLAQHATNDLLENIGYSLLAKTANTGIFKDLHSLGNGGLNPRS